MKTNLFKVRERKAKRIIIEEERLKNPFLLFFKRHKNFILTSGIMIAICLILISTGVAFSLFRGSNDYDISYIEGDETIDTNNNPELDDEDIKDELLGEIAREEGIVLQTKTFMSTQGDVISYFTDGTAIVVQSNGRIYRVSTNDKGEYGVNENGKISGIKILVTSTTSTLMDGTIVTNYSDGTAKVEHKGQVYFVRDSNNIKVSNGSLDVLAPSGVAPVKETSKVTESTLKKFTNNTYLIIKNNGKIIVNKNTDVTIKDNNIEYSSENSFAVIEEKTYKDGYTISYFANGSAIITDKVGNITYVKKSGDIVVLKDLHKLYEIIYNPTGKSYSRTTLNTGEKKVTYFDNAVAIITNKDGTRHYIDDNEDIVYDNNRNIISNPMGPRQISEGIIDTGQTAYNFSNGKSQVIENHGKSYIVDTNRLTFIEKEKPEEKPEEKPSHDDPLQNPWEYFDITPATYEYLDFAKSKRRTRFRIINKTKESKNLMITIEEVKDYKKYNTDKLSAEFVKFQAVLHHEEHYEDIIIEPSILMKDKFRDNERGTTNYVIYKGAINPKAIIDVTLDLYVDYENITNDYNDAKKNYGFVGTLSFYFDDERAQ